MKQSNHKTLLIVALLGIGLITLGHYTTDGHQIWLHNVFRRLYYVPVVLAAFGYGLRGGLGVAVLAVVAYVPHAFFMHHHHQDPAPTLDKVFEIVLYLLVGGLTGWLVQRERRTQEALKASLKERDEMGQALVRAGKLSAMGELLAGVAHELRNPLAAILGAAEGLDRHMEATPRTKRLVELQLREIARLDRVVSSFLAFSKTTPPDRSMQQAGAVVEEIIELAQHHGKAGHFEVDSSLDGISLFVDRDQLSQVLLNLTLNAIDAAQTTPTVRYVWQSREVGQRVYDCLGVVDDGPGLSEEEIGKIFDPYYTTRATGSGLGLSICSRLVEAHDGFIEVESVPDQHTTFWVCLPTEQ